MRKGAKVICNDDLSIAEKKLGVSVPKKDGVYHVRADLGNAVLLEGVVNDPQEGVSGAVELCFSATHFTEVS